MVCGLPQVLRYRSGAFETVDSFRERPDTRQERFPTVPHLHPSRAGMVEQASLLPFVLPIFARLYESFTDTPSLIKEPAWISLSGSTIGATVEGPSSIDG